MSPFEETKSGQMVLKSSRAAKRILVDDNVELARAIGQVIVKHPKKCIAFLIVEGWIHSLVAHHVKEAKTLMEAFNPF